MTKLCVTVSGSFRRFLTEIARDIDELQSAGVTILSPARPYITATLDDFVFLEGDRFAVAEAVQARHLQSIERSTFVWLVAPGGYVGSSAAFEIAWAASHGVPVLSLMQPFEPTVAAHVTTVSSLGAAVRQKDWQLKLSATMERPSMLMDPDSGLELIHRETSQIWASLKAQRARPVLTDPVIGRAATNVREVLNLL